jgi:D-glycero-D-manno-heptose 1,7-bisphosphate phosphatase
VDGRFPNPVNRPRADLSAAVLLDRDGVLTEPVRDELTGTFESPLHPEDVRLAEGAAQAAAQLLSCRLSVFVVSNQPAAAKDIVPLEELHAVHERVVELLALDGVTLSGWEYCFHHPAGVVPGLAGDCVCRKPRPGMLRRAIAEVGHPPDRCWMVGDADTDVIAGCRAGTRTALIEHPLTKHRRSSDGIHLARCHGPDKRAGSLLEFARWLCSPPLA